MTVLVTGGAGYIGSHTVRLLRERGEDVVVLDTLETGHREALLGAPLVVGDVGDTAVLIDLFSAHEFNAVIHFAGYKAPGESMRMPARYFNNNVAGTSSLLEVMADAGVKRMVFSSSCSVYGTPESLPVREAQPAQPESPYAASKHMVEQMLRWFDLCHGLRSVSLRYFNAAGAAFDGRIGEDMDRTSNLIPLVMRAALGRSSAVEVFGTDYLTPDGTAVRDYVHVVDLADAHLKALDYLREHERSETLNLGTSQGTSVQAVIDLVRRVSGRVVPVKYSGRRPGDPAAIWADATKASQVLGWRPRYGLEEIISTAWQWHSTHPNEYATDTNVRVPSAAA